MTLSKLRTRLTVGLVSLSVIGLELALMRSLSVRYWHHFAYMAISVALLGFGASGTALALARPRLVGRERAAMAVLALGFAASIPLTHWAARCVPLDVQSLAWNVVGQVGHVLLLELVLFVPFFLAAGVVGLALLDRPSRLGGHYAANLVGSGLGGVAAVLLMYVLPTDGLFVAMAVAALAAGLVALEWRRLAEAALAAGAAATLALAVWLAPSGPVMSEYKMLPQTLAMPGARVIHRAEGPLGRLDVVAGPSLHFAPGLSLNYTGRVPPHVLAIIDGDDTSAVYDCRSAADWAFLDQTTWAAAYPLRASPRVLVIGAGGGGDIGLALYHGATQVTALEINADIIAAMTGPLRERGGGIYEAPGVRVLRQEARGYLAAGDETFDVIQLPAAEAFGASGAGLFATQESYLYTVEAFSAMLDRLTGDGVLCVTRWARTPPRDGLRVFDTAAEALRRRGAEPGLQLAMIRSWATVTVLAFRRPVRPEECERLRAFCRPRSFDVCYLPDVRADEVNLYHVLDHPYYYDGARALVGPGREAFLRAYPFDVSATTDDRPYFSHFLRWRSLGLLWEQLGERARTYLEVGHLMLAAALAQAVLLSAALIVVPLLWRASAVRRTRGKAAALAYFLLIGAGYMLVEMGFLGRLTLHVAHPVYAAAAVISSFLVFSGLGAHLSRFWSAGLGGGVRLRRDRYVATVAAAAVAAMGAGYLLVLDGWLGLTQGAAVWLRLVVAAATVAPLALAMGHLFPSGLRRLGVGAPALVPWAWAVNGFASVVATVAAPLVVMQTGFARLVLVAAGCYLAAGIVSWRLPTAVRQADRGRAGELAD